MVIAPPKRAGDRNGVHGITRPLLEVWRCRAKRAVSLLSISPVTKWKRLPRTRRALVAYEEAMAFVYACIETMPRDVYRQRAMELADDVDCRDATWRGDAIKQETVHLLTLADEVSESVQLLSFGTRFGWR